MSNGRVFSLPRKIKISIHILMIIIQILMISIQMDTTGALLDEWRLLPGLFCSITGNAGHI